VCGKLIYVWGWGDIDAMSHEKYHNQMSNGMLPVLLVLSAKKQTQTI